MFLVPSASAHGHPGCPEFDQQFRMSLQKENVSSLQKGLSLGKSFCDAGGVQCHEHTSYGVVAAAWPKWCKRGGQLVGGCAEGLRTQLLRLLVPYSLCLKVLVASVLMARIHPRAESVFIWKG